MKAYRNPKADLRHDWVVLLLASDIPLWMRVALWIYKYQLVRTS